VKNAKETMRLAWPLAAELGNLAWRYRAKPRERERDERLQHLHDDLPVGQRLSYEQLARMENMTRTAVIAAIGRARRRLA
jgi:hypothetical protein